MYVYMCTYMYIDKTCGRNTNQHFSGRAVRSSLKYLHVHWQLPVYNLLMRFGINRRINFLSQLFDDID